MATGHGLVVIYAVGFVNLIAVSVVIHEMDCVAWHEHLPPWCRWECASINVGAVRILYRQCLFGQSQQFVTLARSSSPVRDHAGHFGGVVLASKNFCDDAFKNIPYVSGFFGGTSPPGAMTVLCSDCSAVWSRKRGNCDTPRDCFEDSFSVGAASFPDDDDTIVSFGGGVFGLSILVTMKSRVTQDECGPAHGVALEGGEIYRTMIS